MSTASRSPSQKELKESLKTCINNAENLCKTLEKDIEEAQHLKEEWQERLSDINTNINDTNKKCTHIEGIRIDIENLYNGLFVGTKETPAIKDDIKLIFEDFKNMQEEIKDFRKYLFGEERKTKPISIHTRNNYDQSKIIKNENGLFVITEEAKDGLKQNIAKISEDFNNLLSQSEHSFEDQKDKFENGFAAIKEKIENLLPSATSAGLASAYNDAKEIHKNSAKNWAISFGLSMLCITALGIVALICFGEIKEFFDILKVTLRISPFEIPLLWWALLSAKRMKEEYRLHEENLHKWSIARTFEGLSKQAKNLDSENDSQNENNLFNEILKSYAVNPSDVIDIKPSLPLIKIAKMITKFSKAETSELIELLQKMSDNKK